MHHSIIVIKPRRRAKSAELRIDPDIHWSSLCRDAGAWCRLCGDDIDVRLQSPNPLSPSIDHIVHTSNDGSHTWSNVRPAHYGCNSARRIKSDEQWFSEHPHFYERVTFRLIQQMIDDAEAA